MNLLKIFLLVSATIFIVAHSSENNNTIQSNENNRTVLPVVGKINSNIFVKKDIRNNEPIDWTIRLGNADYNKTLTVKANFKVKDILGTILNEFDDVFYIPPRKANTFRSNSLKVSVLKDTKAYIQITIGGVTSRSNYFMIYK